MINAQDFIDSHNAMLEEQRKQDNPPAQQGSGPYPLQGQKTQYPLGK